MKCIKLYAVNTILEVLNTSIDIEPHKHKYRDSVDTWRQGADLYSCVKYYPHLIPSCYAGMSFTVCESPSGLV